MIPQGVEALTTRQMIPQGVEALTTRQMIPQGLEALTTIIVMWYTQNIFFSSTEHCT